MFISFLAGELGKYIKSNRCKISLQLLLQKDICAGFYVINLYKFKLFDINKVFGNV